MPEEVYEGQDVDEYILAHAKVPNMMKWMWEGVIEYKKKQTLVACVDYTQSFIESAFEADKSVEIPRTLNALFKVKQILEMPATVVTNYRNAKNVINGYRRLRDIGVIDATNGAEAADAFGEFFSGMGGLAKYLPPPLDKYVGIFSESRNFFSNVRNCIVPSERYKNRADWNEAMNIINRGA